MMNQLLSHMQHKYFKPAVIIVAVLALSLQSVMTALAVTPVQNSALAIATKAELSRREAAMNDDKKLVENAGDNTGGDAMMAIVNGVLDTIRIRKDALAGATTTAQVTDVANKVDSDYAEFRSSDLAVKLYADLRAQDNSIKSLRELTKQIKDTVDAAKANGATHVNAGVAGFVKLDLINQNIDKLQKTMTASAIVTVALSSAISLLTDNGDVLTQSTAASISQLYEQLSATQNSLSDVAIGLSQLTNIVTGNRVGISYCGFWSNCRGLENNGVIMICGSLTNCVNNSNNGNAQICGDLSNCVNNTNNSGNQVCGSVTNCNGNTNNGGSQSCGSLSNCVGNINNGITQACGSLTNCANNVNNGVFVNCGSLSVCAGDVNNGIAQTCGNLSYCANRTNNGLNQTCGSISLCINNVNNGVNQECGTFSVCASNANNGLNQTCGDASLCINSVNNGVAIACGTFTNCAGTQNNGGVIKCGNGSTCAGATNNGLLIICGVLSNCSGTKTSGLISMCGTTPTCDSSTNHSFITICGNGSDCSNTARICKVNSDGIPIKSASAELNLPLGLEAVSI